MKIIIINIMNDTMRGENKQPTILMRGKLIKRM
jgi:hypothetical protein